MKLLDRYIIATVGKAILLTLLAVSLLTLVLTFIEEVDDIGKGDYKTWDAFVVAASSTPRFIYEGFPVAALIGALLGLGTLASRGELTAMRATGMSRTQILLALLKGGGILLLLVILIGDVLAPITENYGQRLRLEKRHEQIIFSSKHGFWVKDGNAVVNIRQVLPGDQLKGITLYKFDEYSRLAEVIRAAKASYAKPDWKLEAVRQTRIDLDHLEIKRLKQIDWSTLVSPAMLSLAVVKPFMLPMWQLAETVRLLKQNGQDAASYEVAFWTKLATPLATLVMLILALPFVMGDTRSLSAGQRVFSGALLGSLFYLFSRAFSFLVVVYSLPPFLVILFPLLVLILAGLYFGYKIRSA